MVIFLNLRILPLLLLLDYTLSVIFSRRRGTGRENLLSHVRISQGTRRGSSDKGSGMRRMVVILWEMTPLVTGEYNSAEDDTDSGVKYRNQNRDKPE